ncbi:MAG TPA: peptidoglycan-binding domain-containing protein [Clostridia bacterium]|nr:peptidoglycan-binding domain-containing protein [Clostridia bacterium]
MQKSRYVQIPDVITVHLGGKDTDAPNMTMPFVDYVKGCACCLVNPTWPENAQRANIYAITSFALHRVCHRWYRSRGCAFDITGSAEDDLPFNDQACLFYNTSCLVEDMFNNYLTRQGSGEPLPTQICRSGQAVAGSGVLCQPDVVLMAKNGNTVYDILMKYYGEDIVMVQNAPRQGEQERFLGTPLMRGASGDDICVIKRQLNRIGQNYPAIVPLSADSPNFDAPCERAIRAFQYIFDLPVTGVLDKATWYKIKRTCAAIAQSDTDPFAQKAVAVLKPVLDSATTGNTPPNSPTQASPISCSGLDQTPASGNSAMENAANWSTIRESIVQGRPAPEVVPQNSIISDSGVATRAEAENRIPGHATPDGTPPEMALLESTPQDSPISDSGVLERAMQDSTISENSARENAAQWNAARQNEVQKGVMPEGATPESSVTTPEQQTDHRVKIGPSVSTTLPDEGSGIDSGEAVEWLRRFYGL